MSNETEERSWSLDDRDELSPGDFLIGCVTGQWVGDDESMYAATVALLSATLAQAGLDPEAAVDAAMTQADRVTSISWTGSSLTFNMDDEEGDDEEPECARCGGGGLIADDDAGNPCGERPCPCGGKGAQR